MESHTRLQELTERLNEDEAAVLVYIAERLLGPGRTQYGPLDLTEPRVWLRDAAEEAADFLVYAGAHEIVLSRLDTALG